MAVDNRTTCRLTRTPREPAIFAPWRQLRETLRARTRDLLWRLEAALLGPALERETGFTRLRFERLEARHMLATFTDAAPALTLGLLAGD